MQKHATGQTDDFNSHLVARQHTNQILPGTMLINLVPEFLAVLSAGDPVAAYRDYLDRHRPILAAYWHNYVLDLDGPHAEEVIRRTVAANRRDLLTTTNEVDITKVCGEVLAASLRLFEADRPVDCYVMVGVGAANAGELVVGGRGIAFVCAEHFTGRANPETMGLGLPPELLPLWIAHEVAHTVRYTSPTSRSEFARVVGESGGFYDFWETGTRIPLREQLLNEGLAVRAAMAAAPGHAIWEYYGYSRGQYRRVRELDAFLRHATTPDLDRAGLGLRLRYLSAGMSPSARHVAGRVVPERAGYYLGAQLAGPFVERRGIAAALRAAPDEFRKAEEDAHRIETA